jgi:multiple sugar transport system ATP-binding protein
MGDRVAVLKDGYLQQVDTPQNLYDHPDNVFVAAFIGSPSMNLYEGTLTLGSHVLGLPRECLERTRPARVRRPAVIVGIRPRTTRTPA